MVWVLYICALSNRVITLCMIIYETDRQSAIMENYASSLTYHNNLLYTHFLHITYTLLSLLNART